MRDFNIVFSVSPNPDELAAVAKVKPPHILVSYARWYNKCLGKDLLTRIGYYPYIMVDSGAFSFAFSKTNQQIFTMNDVAHKTGVFGEYVRWLWFNRHWYHEAMSLDAIGEPFLSWVSFQKLYKEKLKVIPVHQIGSSPAYLEEYLQMGCTRIALGGTAREGDQPGDIQKRINWALPLVERFKFVSFHMLGTQNEKLIRSIPGLASADGTTWIHAIKDKVDRDMALVSQLKDRLTRTYTQPAYQLRMF